MKKHEEYLVEVHLFPNIRVPRSYVEEGVNHVIERRVFEDEASANMFINNVKHYGLLFDPSDIQYAPPCDIMGFSINVTHTNDTTSIAEPLYDVGIPDN